MSNRKGPWDLRGVRSSHPRVDGRRGLERPVRWRLGLFYRVRFELTASGQPELTTLTTDLDRVASPEVAPSSPLLLLGPSGCHSLKAVDVLFDQKLLELWLFELSYYAVLSDLGHDALGTMD